MTSSDRQLRKRVVNDKDNYLEREKTLRQERSRAAVISGEISLSDNFFIPLEVARRCAYKFKG